MKTRHLIEILRCTSNNYSSCEKCEFFYNCRGSGGNDLPLICAERLEALLENLRRTEAELKEARQEAGMWKKRYARFLNEVKKIVHEQEILDGLGGY